MKSTSKIAILLIGVCFFASNAMFCAKAFAKSKIKEEKPLIIADKEPNFEMREGDVSVKVKDFKYRSGQEFSISFEWSVTDVIENDYTIFVHFFNKGSGDLNNKDIIFRFDHQPNVPTSSWKPKKPVVYLPYNVSAIDKCCSGVYYIGIGFYKDNEADRYNNIMGPNDGASRTILGKLIFKGTPGKITDIKFQPLENEKAVKKTK